MSDRFELSFKNKEVRIWLVIMVSAMIAGALIILFTKIRYRYNIAVSFPLMGWIIFYLWRYLYRRKQKKESSIT